MKRDVTLGALLLLALGVIAAVIRGLDLIGADALRVLALVLAVPGGVAVMALGLTPLVRAWRLPTTPPVERHVIKEVRLQQHTLDRRAPVPAPAPALRQINLYPGLQSAEWRAGLLPDGSNGSQAEMTWETRLPADAGAAAAWPEWPDDGNDF